MAIGKGELMITDTVLAELERYASPQDAVFLQRFFKTGEGQYGAGDVFIGVRVPDTRKVAKIFQGLALEDIEQLLENPIHEVRLTALIIMAEQAKKASLDAKRALYRLYLKRTDRINNWDLVDASCRDVVGGYLLEVPREQSNLQKLAASNNMWERRIAMVSTWQFIRAGKLELTFVIAYRLLGDKQDLIHKAVGWMLREAGKRDVAQLHAFIQAYVTRMPRTTLRYAIERLSAEERAHYLRLK